MSRSVPRIAPATSPAEEITRIIEQGPRGRDGKPLDLLGVLANNPSLFRRFNSFGGYFLLRSSLPDGLRELVTLRLAWRTDCALEWDQHLPMAHAHGVTQDEVLSALKPIDDIDASTLGERERVLLAAADELLDTYTLTDSSWAAVRKVLDEAQSLDFVMLVGFYGMLSSFANALNIGCHPINPSL